MNGGTTTFAVTLLSAQNYLASSISHKLTVGWSLSGDMSPNIPMQASSPPTKIQILLPNETAVPGDVAHQGKTTAAPTPAIAGVGYPITVRLTDDSFNAVGQSAAVGFALTTTDPYDSPDPDTSEFINVNDGSDEVFYTHFFKRASTTGWTITVSTNSGWNYLSATAGPVVVNPNADGAGTQLLVLLSSETYDPGNVSDGGKYGSKDVQIAGSSFSVTIMATDQYWNLISTNPTIALTLLYQSNHR